MPTPAESSFCGHAVGGLYWYAPVRIPATIEPNKNVAVTAGDSEVTGKWKKYYWVSGNSVLSAQATGTGKSHALGESATVQSDLAQQSGSLVGIVNSKHC